MGYPQSKTETIKINRGHLEFPALPYNNPHISEIGGNQLDLRFFSA